MAGKLEETQKVLDRTVREGLSEEATLELKPKGSEGANQVKV